MAPIAREHQKIVERFVERIRLHTAEKNGTVFEVSLNTGASIGESYRVPKITAVHKS